MREPHPFRLLSMPHLEDGMDEKISKAAVEYGKVQDILLEVNVSGEESKGGLKPEDLPGMITDCLQLEGVRLRGLMTMAPQGDVEVARDCFQRLSLLLHESADLMGIGAEHFDQLSMGMTEDWPEAVDEGSTIVRVGRAIFGF